MIRSGAASVAPTFASPREESLKRVPPPLVIVQRFLAQRSPIYSFLVLSKTYVDYTFLGLSLPLRRLAVWRGAHVIHMAVVYMMLEGRGILNLHMGLDIARLILTRRWLARSFVHQRCRIELIRLAVSEPGDEHDVEQTGVNSASIPEHGHRPWPKSFFIRLRLILKRPWPRQVKGLIGTIEVSNVNRSIRSSRF